MASPKVNTFREVAPLVYSWMTPDIPKYSGWEKIGYTEQESAEQRIAQQASQLGIEKKMLWARRALYTSRLGGSFTDREFHAYLSQRDVERETNPRTEWFHFEPAPKESLDYFNDFAAQEFTDFQLGEVQDDYELRPEQQGAVEQTVDAFQESKDEVLWNAKPRFGKTLTAYDLAIAKDAKRVLIVTNRPAIANSWFDDFTRFIAHRTNFKFVSDSPSLTGRRAMSREQWLAFSRNHEGEHPRIIEFLSLQDLKGSQYFGGSFKKLKHIAELEWDLLIIDEAHEGVDTAKTDIAFDQIKRKWTIHLSGTPFKALASGKFSQDQIFNWTYLDEQTARQNWDDSKGENPYAALPRLNMLTYQLSPMITDRLSEGVAIDEDEANIDYAFDLNEFFATKSNGFFEHEEEILKFLDCLATNEKYPFSTPELRNEIRHSFWLLNRVASAKALEKLLKKHEVFKDYKVVLAAGDGRSEEDDPIVVGKSFDKVREAIAEAEESNGKTITLSVGQLTTGVTVPEWTAVIMLSNLSSPSLYMQAAFRAQNPFTFERGGHVFRKENAYIFDFAPERTLMIFDAFANNLQETPAPDPALRQENIRTLLNFFPVIGEDSEGQMVELDAAQVLTFPQVFKAREVVRRGFLSNLLFDNVAGIFRYSEHVKEILDKLPTAKQGKVVQGDPIEIPHPPPVTDPAGNVQVDPETVINPKVEELGRPVYRVEDIPDLDPGTPASTAATRLAKAVTEQTREKRTELKDEYGLTAKQIERDEKRTEQEIKNKVERIYADHGITSKHLEDELKDAATEAEAEAVKARQAEQNEAFKGQVLSIVEETMESIVPDVVTREETKKEQKRADETMDDARSHLRGFARTIPMFLMAYGDRDIRLSNFDDYTPDDVFEEITGITEEEFRLLRDGQEVTEDDGSVTTIPGMFDEAVFDQSIQEFLDKKEELADYFDEEQTEDIFAYIPQQKTSLVFTQQPVVKLMVDALEAENPGIFKDPDKTFADLFSTAGLFLMELVRRLDVGLADQFPDQDERLRHILGSQVFEMSHNEILHRITIEAVSGGVEKRKEWMTSSGHFKVGNLARMDTEERQQLANDMLAEGQQMDSKFDTIIGNPPYQEEAQGEGTRDTPVYHHFMDGAYEVSEKAVLITPARFLFNAGFTPKAWNEKMLADPSLTVSHYAASSAALFPGTDIKGGIAVTYRDKDQEGEPIGIFTKYPELNEILHKVIATGGDSIDGTVSSGRAYAYTQTMHDENPEASATMSSDAQFRVSTNAFDQLPSLYHEDRPADGHDYVQVLGLIKNKRLTQWIRSDYITGPESFRAYKVAVSKANGSGTFGEVLASPLVLGPGVATTQTFITIGNFKDQPEADACLKYVKSKFARAMLGVLKITQDNPAKVWKYVPLQDFASDSDIDWTNPIPEIDQQLYEKYDLNPDEINFIDSKVQPMA